MRHGVYTGIGIGCFHCFAKLHVVQLKVYISGIMNPDMLGVGLKTESFVLDFSAKGRGLGLELKD